MATFKKLKIGSSVYDTSVYDANISWGGRDLPGQTSPIDAALISDLSANRFAFAKPAGITVEYSTDGGSTWVDYGLTDTQKIALVSTEYTLTAGKEYTNPNINKQLRVTINAHTCGTYFLCRKLAMLFSTGGCTCYVKVERATGANPTSFTTLDTARIAGWSGWNIIQNYSVFSLGGGNSQTSNWWVIRLTFYCTAVNTTYGMFQVYKIFAFGETQWAAPSTMSSTGHLYGYDSGQNATFPAKLSATGDLSTSGTLSVSSTATIGSTLSVPQINTASTSTAVYIYTGTNANSYFQCKKFRGEGTAASYPHAIDFGYAGHDQVDFYEWGGVYNFWKNTQQTAVSNDANKVASLQLGKLVERGNTLTYPNKSGTLALTSDLKTSATFSGAQATLSSSGTAESAGSHNHTFTGTAGTISTSTKYTPTGTNASTGSHTHTFSGSASYTPAGSIGSSGSHSHTITGTYDAETTCLTLTTASTGSHDHTFTGTQATITHSGNTGSAGSHTHTFTGTEATISPSGSFTPAGTVSAGGSHTHSVTTSTTYTPEGSVTLS